jgi:protein phosphatase
MGVDEDVEIDGYTYGLQGVRTLLLCSDGLFGMLSNDEIKSAVMSDDSPEERVKALQFAANDAGGHDNISIILIDIKG